MGRSNRRTRARTKFRQEKGLPLEESSTSTSSSTPERTEGISGLDVQGSSTAHDNNSDVDSESELIKELEKLEEQKKELRKKELRAKIRKVKGDIESMSKSNENISSLQKKGDIERSQGSGKVTMNELRELRNLQEEVDLQMQGACDVFGEDSYEESAESRTTKHGKKSGMHLKSADSVKFPQLWPHCFLYIILSVALQSIET